MYKKNRPVYFERNCKRSLNSLDGISVAHMLSSAICIASWRKTIDIRYPCARAYGPLLKCFILQEKAEELHS